MRDGDVSRSSRVAAPPEFNSVLLGVVLTPTFVFWALPNPSFADRRCLSRCFFFTALAHFRCLLSTAIFVWANFLVFDFLHFFSTWLGINWTSIKKQWLGVFWSPLLKNFWWSHESLDSTFRFYSYMAGFDRTLPLFDASVFLFIQEKSIIHILRKKKCSRWPYSSQKLCRKVYQCEKKGIVLIWKSKKSWESFGDERITEHIFQNSFSFRNLEV